MPETGRLDRARSLFQEAYKEQMEGRYEQAVDLYKASIEHHATAEAHTFLGWTYSFQDRYPDAIAECEKAIAVDPEFGNPYNDIGSYLIQSGTCEEAIPWLVRAKEAPRYEPRHVPYLNLARAYMALGRTEDAVRELQQARFLQQHVEDSDEPEQTEGPAGPPTPPADGGDVTVH